MIKRILMCAAVVLCVAGMSFAGPQDKMAKGDSSKSGSSWTGWITDSDCGAKGTSEKHADCARKCVADKGAKYVLYNTSDKKVYNLDDQSAAAEHVAHLVKVKGTMDGDTIHVSSITASASHQKSASSDKSGS
jgi:hypothetical protein